MSQVFISNVLAIGVDQYSDELLGDLSGPSKDIELLEKFMVDNETFATVKKGSFLSLSNPSSSELREHITSLTLSKSADLDVLFFYFSGHGIKIGNEFGLCLTDSRINQKTSLPVRTTVLTINEIVSTLHDVNIIPFIVIDACFSGSAIKSSFPLSQIPDIVRKDVREIVSSQYAIFCSCKDHQISIDTLTGGIFSNAIFNVIEQGIKDKRSQYITLQTLFPLVQEYILKAHFADFTPKLYIDDVFPNVVIAKNKNYRPQFYKFTDYYLCILKAMWNNGNEKPLSRSEIDNLCGKSAYGNHSKLSAAPWGLVENFKYKGEIHRRLTDRGRNFLKGKLAIPAAIRKDRGDFYSIPSDGEIDINSFR